MDNSAAHLTASHLNAPHPKTEQHFSTLQAVSLDDYEQLVSTRVSFVDFLLGSGGAAA